MNKQGKWAANEPVVGLPTPLFLLPLNLWPVFRRIQLDRHNRTVLFCVNIDLMFGYNAATLSGVGFFTAK